MNLSFNSPSIVPQKVFITFIITKIILQEKTILPPIAAKTQKYSYYYDYDVKTE